MKKEKRIHISILGILLFLVLLCGSLAACDTQAGNNQTQTNGPVAGMEVPTVYGTLRFPVKLEEHLRHMEIMEENVTMEIFYLRQETGELELFRIYFGAPTMGREYGYLTVDGKEIPVTYAVCEYVQEDFPSEEDWILYCDMMDGFTMLLNSLGNDSRFSATKAVEIAREVKVKLAYWEVSIPETMEYAEESTESGYRVTFYGTVGGQRMELFALQLGEPLLQTKLGTYTVKGEAMPLSLESNEALMDLVLEEEEQIRLYDMMDSINGVLEVILSDKNFAE